MVNQHERSKAPHRSAILMNDRRLVVSALVMLMMSGWSGAALAAIGDADVDGAKYGDSRADDATWGAVSNDWLDLLALRKLRPTE